MYANLIDSVASVSSVFFYILLLVRFNTFACLRQRLGYGGQGSWCAGPVLRSVYLFAFSRSQFVFVCVCLFCARHKHLCFIFGHILPTCHL